MNANFMSYPSSMESISLSSTITSAASTSSPTATVNSMATQFCLPSNISLHAQYPGRRRSRNVCWDKKPRKVCVSASKGEPPELDRWEQMELKFGRMLGEDPKLTMAKIMARKANPDLTPLEIENLIEKKKKGKSKNSAIEEVVSFDMEWERKAATSIDGVNLVRPVTPKGVKFETNEKSFEVQKRKPTQPVGEAVKNNTSKVPNVILRKPTTYKDEDSSKYSIRPNLSLRMGKEQQKERFSDITLLKRPEKIISDGESESGQSNNSEANGSSPNEFSDITLLKRPEKVSADSEGENDESGDSKADGSSPNVENEEKQESPDSISIGDSYQEPKTDISNPGISTDAMLLGKPKRLDQSVKVTSTIVKEQIPENRETSGRVIALEDFLSSPMKDIEEQDWKRAEDLVLSGERGDVEIVSSSTRGFTVSFYSLIGFLPYRNLASKWKFLAFESWLRRRGLDPSKYRKSLGVIGNSEAAGIIPSTDLRLDIDIDDKLGSEVNPDMKLEDLLKIYDQQKLKFLSSFVGQKIRVVAVLADRKSRRLVFSAKPKENEENITKKRNLMAKLSVGDVVTCTIKKITYFGIFVEIEGVPALIHQTEVSWDATLDPSSFFKVGQIVEAKVHQLDFSLDRIFLSLKEITPDPLIEALDAVVGGHDSSDSQLKEAQADTEWQEVESLIKELQQVEGIQSVVKGRYFVSPGLAPTFQVYMASIFENQYKLLARSGNRAQEVIVDTSLGKEEMKSIILTCTNRVQ
ncbi:OLC1v1029628C3 [Oldenlandia corymbosa var. corymbosa]|uniref:OLC1v1029628C3 n=1 Tax=Oldenlandia corymbosa var. corymbosa TaxID=529605 RepID=A0AAV1CG32_OLDCO|nr:OLC1v1029628C3 [Oldenlandia corymbosa var. corymbosa]